ncbi:MAG: hypothetical protein HPY82_13225 [Gammaproteobacteria bacterium]|nr:hypothetical protein [Gammaproteobacteria bacterium]
MIEKKFKPQGIPVEFLKIYNEPDGTLYSGILNPFLPERDGVAAPDRGAQRRHGHHLGRRFRQPFPGR